MRKLNVLTIDLEQRLDEAGFRHAVTPLRGRLGAQQIGAAVYGAEAGDTIWPYHFHHGTEEWLYVISGNPVLRDDDGHRQLDPGDLVCFPSGPRGVHTLAGPGRFMIFSVAAARAPRMSVYPDSGKVSGPEGILLASSRVGYWYGEGTWEPSADQQPEPLRPREFSRQAIVNLNAAAASAPPPRGARPGFAARLRPLGPELGAEMLGATLYELDPGEGTAPYHYHGGREEWLLVLAGRPALRHPGGEDVMDAGDLVCFVEGAEGAHRVLNRGAQPARVLLLSTMELPVTAHYPDSEKLLIRDADGRSHVFRKADAVDYWEGESSPSQGSR